MANESLVALIGVLKEILRPPEPPKEPTLVETLTTLKELGIVSPTIKEDEGTMLEKMKLLKDGLGIKFVHETVEKEDDTMKSVEEVKSLAAVLQPYLPKASSSAPNLSSFEGLFTAAPALLGAIKEIFELHRLNQYYKFLTAPRPQPMPRENENGEEGKGAIPGGRGKYQPW